MMKEEKEVSINLENEGASLKGILAYPKTFKTVVVFAHGSGSGRLSPRNQFVAQALQEEGLGTLLMDLLTVEEEKIDIYTREFRFDIPLLSRRLVGVTKWLLDQPDTKDYRVSFFGASTGAAAALIAAAEMGSKIAAVVSRGGRPDLAAPFLPKVQAPTLLIVGAKDFGVIELNEQAYSLLSGVKKLELVQGATHLFEEAGALEKISNLSCQWFKKYQ